MDANTIKSIADVRSYKFRTISSASIADLRDAMAVLQEEHYAQRRCRFVEEVDGSEAQDTVESEKEATALASRQDCALGIGDRGQIEKGDGRVDDVARGFAKSQGRTVEQVFAHGHPFGEVRLLRHKGDVRLAQRRTRGVFEGHHGRARGGNIYWQPLR